MTLRMYDLAGADPARRFSPYCWRVKLALAAKGLPVETIPWRFSERAAIAAHGAEKVPVLLDGDRVVTESLAIAEYLEATYHDQPSLFGGPGGLALARFVNAWADAVVNAGLVKLVVADIVQVLHADDTAYFRQSREARFGMPLEAVQADRTGRWKPSAATCIRCA
ncbi:glutathione S-transferase family protein [Roseomonas sp. CGMCC 1.13459]|uniref:glutathione S-transferase family protein n=1 Tax=Roseomonas sp. CGMCC 1.13459 TaxID=3317349 RepID=UPI001E622A30|nr:glutathione S-transferase N-terminal domain-containing protein [Roseomonas oleicola]